MTSEPQTELGAEPGQAWLQDKQVPTGQEAHVVHSGRPGRLRSGPPIARSLPSARSVRSGARRCSPTQAISSPRSLSPFLVYGRTHSAFLTALAYALTYLPPIAGGPLLSGLADLFPRRHDRL